MGHEFVKSGMYLQCIHCSQLMVLNNISTEIDCIQQQKVNNSHTWIRKNFRECWCDKCGAISLRTPPFTTYSCNDMIIRSIIE